MKFSSFFFVLKNGIAKLNEKSLPKEIDKWSQLQLMFPFFYFNVFLRNAFIPAHDLWDEDMNGECCLQPMLC